MAGLVVKDCLGCWPAWAVLGAVSYTSVGGNLFPYDRRVSGGGTRGFVGGLGENKQRQLQKRNAGVTPLRRQSAPPPVEMTAFVGD